MPRICLSQREVGMKLEGGGPSKFISPVAVSCEMGPEAGPMIVTIKLELPYIHSSILVWIMDILS